MFLADPEATEAAGRALGDVIAVGDVVALSGPLGVGKTSFARGLIGALGFAAEVPSPSFGIVIPYAPPEVRVPIWHVDLYRIEDAQEFDELGLDDARVDSVLVIEWPERLGTRLWPDALRIDLAVEGTLEGAGRRLTATVPPSWKTRWPFP
jgi:tRNA threonylcarbamoyladenosine biosynthesis protein TsaE